MVGEGRLSQKRSLATGHGQGHEAVRVDLILIRKSTVSRHAAISGAEPDPIRVVRWLLGDGRSGGGFEGDLVAENLQLADVVALGALSVEAGGLKTKPQGGGIG